MVARRESWLVNLSSKPMTTCIFSSLSGQTYTGSMRRLTSMGTQLEAIGTVTEVATGWYSFTTSQTGIVAVFLTGADAEETIWFNLDLGSIVVGVGDYYAAVNAVVISVPVTRTTDDTNPIFFWWPYSGDSISGVVKITQGGTTGSETAIQTPVSTSVSRAGYYQYKIPYAPADRPTAEGVAEYTLTSTNHTGYLVLNVGGAMATVLPVSAVVEAVTSASYISINTAEAVVVTVGTYNADGTAFSTVGMSLELVFESGSTEVVISNSDITKSTTGFAFTVPSTLNSSERLWSYVCRKTTDEAVICKGRFEVNYAANN